MGRKTHEGKDPQMPERVSFSLSSPPAPVIFFPLTAELSPFLTAWGAF